MKFLKPFVFDWYRKLLRHPKYSWLVILGSILYLVGPLDISPDIFPVIGWLDDGLVATLLVTEVSQVLKENFKNQSKASKSVKSQENADPSVIDVKAVAVSK
ncbi:MAG: hypothetical protein N5P05_001648 [Chroococcopsis gigantea SAG 12.99]|nr:hypothetical protein [Chroococcopsis gigantea SAG 12.99]